MSRIATLAVKFALAATVGLGLLGAAGHLAGANGPHRVSASVSLTADAPTDTTPDDVPWG